MRKIKIALFVLAMLASAAGGAFVALKVAAGTDVGDMIVQRKIQDRVSEKISRIRATQGDTIKFISHYSFKTICVTSNTHRTHSHICRIHIRTR